MRQLLGNDFHHDLRVLEELYPDHFIGAWCPDDYKVFDDDLTDEECIAVTQRIERNFDAGIGVHWDVIEYHVEQVTAERPQKIE